MATFDVLVAADMNERAKKAQLDQKRWRTYLKKRDPDEPLISIDEPLDDSDVSTESISVHSLDDYDELASATPEVTITVTAPEAETDNYPRTLRRTKKSSNIKDLCYIDGLKGPAKKGAVKASHRAPRVEHIAGFLGPLFIYRSASIANFTRLGAKVDAQGLKVKPTRSR